MGDSVVRELGDAENSNLPSQIEIALDNRSFEIQLFWQRSNYFLVLISAFAIGIYASSDPYTSLLASFSATVSSFFWYRTNLGSKFWQESWEAEVIELAETYNLVSFVRTTSQSKELVREHFGSDMIGFKSGWKSGGPNITKRIKLAVRAHINKKVLEKYSVTYYMILLSICSCVIWIGLMIYFASIIFLLYF